MITIDKIDFSKLKPYDGKATKCFEHLCYQIAQKEYGHLGTFTAIDGSGGDGGVEFYLILSNGDKWGWQCKFFGDTGRLNSGNRKKQIEKSLETASRNHSDLKKWFLCLKTDLTADSIAPDGKVSKGEQSWFDNELNSIVTGRNIVLEFWGESKILGLINSEKHNGIKSFFFGELEFTQKWFKNKFIENFEKVKDKYDPNLHSIDRYTQSKIDFFLFGTNYCEQLEMLKKELLVISDKALSAIKEFKNERMIGEKEEIQRENFVLYCNEFKSHLSFTLSKIEYVEQCFKEYNSKSVPLNILQELETDFMNFFLKIDYTVFEEKSTTYRDASEIYELLSDFSRAYNQFFRNYFHDFQKEIHFLADAAKGKTHISCDIAYKQIFADKPAIFITGDKFTDETSITEALLKNLDINHEFSFSDFLQTLDVYASITKTRIPIIIDGLNETTNNRFFSQIWKNHLAGFVSKISDTANIVVITTCRNSYVNRIWDNVNDRKFHHLYGFEDYETILDALTKYFRKYKLKADLFFASIEKFEDPILLKIFCEIKNPNWKVSNEIEVNLEEESTFDIFNEYLNQVNKKVTQDNHFLRQNESFIWEKLEILSNHLWQNNLREIPIKDFYNLIDEGEQYDKDKSKADILIHEGLVVTRDMRGSQEYVSFTYDVLAGYMIGKSLIKNKKSQKYFISKEFIQKISQSEGQHPYYEDVISSICLLLPKLKSTSIHEIIQRDKIINFSKGKLYKRLPKVVQDRFSNRISYAKFAFGTSINSLFKLPAKYVKESDVKLINTLFNQSNQNKEFFFDQFFKTLSDISHPLNALFLSSLLESMPMNLRDIYWSEFIRKKYYDLEDFISEFEKKCKLTNEESPIIIKKQHILSRIIVWLLTSTNRALRDVSTRALYYYGRKFPKEFLELVLDSLNFNDPYIWERTLASLYGVSMAEHNSFKSDEFRKNILPEIGKTIYKLMFKKDAPHSTTHILARDYARRIIEITLIHHPNIISEKEIQNIRPPYSFGGIRDLGEFDYGENEFGVSRPIRMDFSNYTIGSIVKDGHSYSNPPEKIKVRRQIYWRIYNLGWSQELFENVEVSLGNDNYYSGRTERAKVERYGKKYSWIAFFENAGLRNDLGLLDNEWDRFRISSADIDPSFPIKENNELFVTDDLLGDRKLPLEQWYANGGMPFIENYVVQKNLFDNGQEWLCLDAYIGQEDIEYARNRFTFIRSLLVKEEDYSEVIGLLNKQSFGGRWIPEKHGNYYSYSGELYYCKDATYDNITELQFELAKKTVKIKKGEPGYYPTFLWDNDGENINLKEEFPAFIEREVSETKSFDVLLPVMEYNWEGHHSYLNEAGHSTVVSKEIANHLNLINQPQTFDLYEINGQKASISINYHKDYNNSQKLIYFRKDLLDKYLKENKMKFVWLIWGEREVSFKNDIKRKEFFDANPFDGYQLFQKVIEY